MRFAGTRDAARLLLGGMMSDAEATAEARKHSDDKRHNLFKAHSYTRTLNSCIMLYGLLQGFYIFIFGSDKHRVICTARACLQVRSLAEPNPIPALRVGGWLRT